MNYSIKIICLFPLILISVLCRAQRSKTPDVRILDTASYLQDPNRNICVKSLTVTGTRKAKVYIVYREIQFREGDSLRVADLESALKQARYQVYNTTLFNNVKFELTTLDSLNAVIAVQVTERWYLYPIPQFQWVDRNFNEWYKTYKADLNRVNYGIKFVHYNLSGRKDQLRVYVINGYSRNITFSYTAPYSNKALTEGFTVGGGFIQKRELPFKTSYRDSLLFFPIDSATKARAEFVFKNWYATAGFIIRRGLFKKHILSVNYNYIKVADEVITAKYNPNYFKDSVSSRGILDLIYAQQYANVDNGSYPLKGRTWYFFLQKRGLGFSGGVNMFTLEGGYHKYVDFGHNWYGDLYLNGKLKLPFNQAYINQRGLGYGENYLRGLEYYVIDGVATALVKTTFRKKLLSFNIPFPFFPRLLTKIPVTFFAKTYTDLGFAYTQKNYKTNLNNRLLYSGGFGIDILTLYDINLRFEYSFNQLNENGLFLHNQSGF